MRRVLAQSQYSAEATQRLSPWFQTRAGASPAPDARGSALTPRLLWLKLLPPSATTAPEGRASPAPAGAVRSASRLCSSCRGTAVRLLITM